MPIGMTELPIATTPPVQLPEEPVAEQ